MIIDDVTPALQAEADNVDKDAKAGSDKLMAQRPVQNFIKMCIPVGSTLQFTQSVDTCVVISGRKDSYQDEEISLTALTKKLLDTDRPLRPAPYWQFEGKKLKDIYDDTYE
jgi:hypothetical protein